MDIKKLRQDRADALNAAKALHAAAGINPMTAEAGAQYDAHMANVASLDANIIRAQQMLDAERTAPAIQVEVSAPEASKQKFSGLGEQLLAVKNFAMSGGRNRDERLFASAPGQNETIDTEGGFLVSAFGYAILVIPTLGYITGASQTANGSQTQKFIAAIMAMPWGRWVIGILGLCVLAGGLVQVYLGFKSDFDRQFQTYDLNSEEVKLATDVGRFGTSARGVVFALTGVLMMLAAYNANPSQPVGMDTALSTLMHQPYGVWLLAVVAVGLIAFGFYSIMSGLWFRSRRNS